MALGKRKPKQASLWVETSHLRAHGSHPFYRRLNEILERANFDACVERTYRKWLRPGHGPSVPRAGGLPPLFSVGYFEESDFERGIT